MDDLILSVGNGNGWSGAGFWLGAASMFKGLIEAAEAALEGHSDDHSSLAACIGHSEGEGLFCTGHDRDDGDEGDGDGDGDGDVGDGEVATGVDCWLPIEASWTRPGFLFDLTSLFFHFTKAKMISSVQRHINKERLRGV